MKNLSIFTLALIFSSVNAALFQRQSEGMCPEVSTVDSLNVEAYLGTWYETIGFIWAATPEGSYCVAAEYELLENGFISVYNQEIRGSTGEFDDACGTACQPDPERPGELVVTFGPVTDDFCVYDDVSEAKGNYLILGVQEDSFSSVYACEQIGEQMFEQAWLLTRSPEPTDEVIQEAVSYFDANGVNIATLVPFPSGDSAGCTYESPDGSTTCLV